MLTDIEIAQRATPLPIDQIASRAGIAPEYLEPYGRYMAKVDPALLKAPGREGKLILVTAITPTPAGEGKTTTTVGLADGLNRLGLRAMVALREPSLGPVFGVKGGATGGGYAQVLPMEDINLHFTGDFHAIGAANNLLAAMVDNHIQQGNALGIDPRRITWRRAVDMNDRQLRHIVSGLGGRANGMPREDGFDITVASEVMAVVCLAKDIPDLKERLSRMVVGYTFDQRPVTCGDLKAQGAMAALLVKAIRPSFSFRSVMLVDRHSTAMISLATVISKPSSRGTPWALPPRPSTMWRSCRSFMSTARFQVICLTSMPRALPCWMWLSSMAAIRLLAAPMAWKSPVKCRLMSSMGTTWA